MPDRSRVFEEAQTVLRTLLREIDERAPGLITDTYVAGSIALGDARPGRSDVDLVLVRRDDADNLTTMQALAPVIARLRDSHSRPALDGIVLSRRDLALGPDRVERERPVIFEQQATLSDGGSARNPVTWQTLAQCGMTWRGAPIAELDLWSDPVRLRTWTMANLEEYWSPWLARSARLTSRGGLWSLRQDFTEWGVLGVTRLHATVRTGAILSKHGAGTYALDTFPSRWHRIVLEAMRIREGSDETSSLYQSPIRRRNDACAFVAMVMEDTREAAPGGRREG